jgi:hypothetical protein
MSDRSFSSSADPVLTGRTPATIRTADPVVERTAPSAPEWPACGLFNRAEVLRRSANACGSPARLRLGLPRQRTCEQNRRRRGDGEHQLAHRIAPLFEPPRDNGNIGRSPVQLPDLCAAQEQTRTSPRAQITVFLFRWLACGTAAMHCEALERRAERDLPVAARPNDQIGKSRHARGPRRARSRHSHDT